MKIKQCKGFDIERCKTCKRQNDKAELLVKAINQDGTCIHYVYDKNQIKDRNKIK